MATAALPSARPRPRPGLILAALVLAVLGVAVALPGVITDADPLAGDPALALAPPGPEHPFGTDHLGRDVLARVVHGARHSLSIGLFATSAAVAAGVLLGLAAGLAHRWIDEALARYTASRRVAWVTPLPMSSPTRPARSGRFGVAIAFVLLLFLFALALSIVLKPRSNDMPQELSRLTSPLCAGLERPHGSA